MLNMQKCAYEYRHSLQQHKYISLIDRLCHFASNTCFIIHIYGCHGKKKLSVPIYSLVQMDSGLDVQFTCSCESPQVSKTKIRNSISPSTTGINHTSVTDRKSWGGGKNRGENESVRVTERWGLSISFNVESWGLILYADTVLQKPVVVLGRYTA